MSILRRSRLSDVLFLMPVRLADEKLPRGKTRMLYCDASGKVYTSIISRSVYELARNNAEIMERSHKSFATLGLETSPGNFIPASIEIDTEEAWALAHILDHALKKGRLPDMLKKYLKPIITRGQANREAILSENRRGGRRTYEEATPRVLNRLPYYSEDNIEFSVPIYKAEYSYPLIVLKWLSSSKPASHNAQRLLVLDSDGDLTVVTIPYRLMAKAEKEMKEKGEKKSRHVCMIILKQKEGLAIDYMELNTLQRKALDTITKYFGENGYGKQPVSTAVRTVLARAKDRVSSVAG